MAAAAAEEVRNQDLGGLPYHPLVFHLDLAVLSYQLYAQSLVWPFDPYYDTWSKPPSAREEVLGKVRAWAASTGAEQVEDHAGLAAYRGPGALSGLPDNPLLDPIVFRYDRVNPWAPALTHPYIQWDQYLSLDWITRSIGEVYVVAQEIGAPAGTLVMEPLAVPGREVSADSRDVLLSFEGVTGDKGEADQPGSQSLMGFVLLRNHPDGQSYDAHIVFRGSRSGHTNRAAKSALSDGKASGNPDWVTDLGYNLVAPESGASVISTTGQVSRGMAASTRAVLPAVMLCLQKVSELTDGRPPARIYVTGHSLGGALAQHFTSAMLMGDTYGPLGAGEQMPSELRDWPWTELKLITFGAPRAGDEEWARALGADLLDAAFFSTPFIPVDRDALSSFDEDIIPRLTDPDHTAGYRVLVSTDPITTQKVVGGKHVGTSVYVDDPGRLRWISLPNFDAHEPWLIREQLLEGLDDPRIPSEAVWRYLEKPELEALGRERGRGSLESLSAMAAEVDRFYLEQGAAFDHEGFAADTAMLLSILGEEAPEEP